MAFFLLCLFTFVMFFQPSFVWPALAQYRPYRYSAIAAIVSFIFFGKKSDIALFSVSNARWFFLFVAMQLLSAAAIWIHGAVDLFLNTWLNLLIIYVIIVKTCTNEKKIEIIILMIVSALIYLSYYSINDYVSNYFSGYRAIGFGWYEEANDISLILTCAIPLAFCLAELSNSFLNRYCFITIAGLFGLNILLCGSRNGLLGLMSVGCLSLLFMKKISRPIKISILIVLVGSIIGFGIANVLSRSDLQSTGLTGDDSSESRIIQWKACMRMTFHHPLLGVGPNEARFQARDYGGIRGLMPHNTLVQVFAETGIPGGIFFLMCTIYPLWEAWRFFKIKENRDRTEKPFLIIYKYLVIALSGFWICAFFSNRVYFKILYVLIALITALRTHYLEARTDE